MEQGVSRTAGEADMISFIVGVIVGAVAVVAAFAYAIVRSERNEDKKS